MMQKPLKIRPPCHILADNFITGPSLKNLNIAFLTKWPYMLKVYWHFKCQCTFSIYGHLVKKSYVQIFERQPGSENIMQKVPGGGVFSVFKHDNYQVSLIPGFVQLWI